MTGIVDDPWVTVAAATSEREADEMTLVLEARGVQHQWLQVPEGWSLVVRQRQAALARDELLAYSRETIAAGHAPRPLVMVGNGWPGAVVYGALLVLIAVWTRQSAFGFDWLAVGTMDAGRMTGGEWWRAVTALTLHREADHLLGNLAFGGFFAYFAARYLGTAVAWAGIVAAGTLGNILNGLAQSPDHRAIGASTAVFGTLGLLTAFTWRRRLSPAASMRVRTAPLIAGVALLAYTGAGGVNTDVGAHLTGFLSGLAIGAACARLALPVPKVVEVAAGTTAGALIVLSWIWGFAAGR